MTIIAKLTGKTPTFFGEETIYENLSFEGVDNNETFLMTITNPYLSASLEIGKSYSFDINKID